MMLTNMQLRRQAIRAWPSHPLASRKQINHIRREWIKKIELLGDKWLFAKVNHVEQRT